MLTRLIAATVMSTASLIALSAHAIVWRALHLLGHLLQPALQLGVVEEAAEALHQWSPRSWKKKSGITARVTRAESWEASSGSPVRDGDVVEREDADQPLAVDDHEPADAVADHQLGRLLDLHLGARR